VRRALLLVLVVTLVGAPAFADERTAARRFDEARRDEPSLIAFLKAMPKGGDLHHHFPWGTFAEDFLRSAAERGLYYDPATSRFSTTPGPVTAQKVLDDDALRYQFLNRASMRGATAGPAGGHDHFFRTFGIAGTSLSGADVAEFLAEIVRRARQQNMQYLELMTNPAPAELDRFRNAATKDDTPETVMTRLKPELDAYVTAARAELDRWERALASSTGADRPVTVRYLRYAIRTDPDPKIMATWLSAFVLMKADPRVVGVNFAAPEDHPIAQGGFERHMKILDGLWTMFDRPNVSLHAGELTPWLSPLTPMTSRIRRSIEIGHARRIGHGVSVAWEDDLPGLLKKMRTDGIAVEICPTSNAVILGVEGDRHPFRLYRRAGVPLTINSDDEGISRSNLTMEFLRAVRAWSLTYADLKALVRNSVEYSFLPGESLFEQRDYRRVRAPYRGLKTRGWAPNATDERALAGSDKASVQARLERAFADFER
jgi:hypothetical protein